MLTAVLLYSSGGTFTVCIVKLPYQDQAEEVFNKQLKLGVKRMYNKKTKWKISEIGTPISCSIYLDDRFVEIDGKIKLYTTASGNPCLLNIYNITDDCLEHTAELSGSQHCWSHGIDSKGRLYIAPQDKAKLFRYSPDTKQLEDLGGIFNQVAAYQISFDENDNAYMGTFPDGLVVRYDERTGVFSNYEQLAKGHSYVHSLAYYNGYLYAGTAAIGAKLFRLNIDTGEKKEIYFPDKYSKEKIESIYAMTKVGKYLFLYIFYGEEHLLLIYDLVLDEWTKVEVKGFGGLFVSPLVNGKNYFSVYDEFWSFDPVTHHIENTGLPAPSQGKGFGSFCLNNGKKETLAVLNHFGPELMLVNFEDKKMRRIPMRERLKGGNLTLTTIEQGGDRELYIGAYMGSRGSVYNIDTGDFRTIFLDQAEGMVKANNDMYFGVYPGGRIYRYDTKKKPDTPELIHRIGQEQDRPFAMFFEENKLYVGTVPGYNKLGGALSIYDMISDKWQTFRNVVEDQSICGLVCKKKLIYGATSIWGGLGAEPIQTSAKIFVWDTVENTKLCEFEPQIEGIDGSLDKIGGISFLPDGLLWCVGRKLRQAAIFALDIDTFEVKKSIVLQLRKALNPWRPNYLHFCSDGRLYTNVDGILAIDLYSLEYEKAVDEQVGQLALAENGNLYFGAGIYLKKLELL